MPPWVNPVRSDDMVRSEDASVDPLGWMPFTNDGYPAPGRYPLTLEQIKAGFVDSSRFAASVTRRPCFSGLTTYVARWRELEDRMEEVLAGQRLLLSAWLGGSFISLGRLDPNKC